MFLQNISTVSKYPPKILISNFLKRKNGNCQLRNPQTPP